MDGRDTWMVAICWSTERQFSLADCSICPGPPWAPGLGSFGQSFHSTKKAATRSLHGDALKVMLAALHGVKRCLWPHGSIVQHSSPLT